MDQDSASVIPYFIQKNLLIFLLAGVGILLLVFGLFQMLTPKGSEVVIEKASSQDKASADVSPLTTKKIIIDVEGAVVKPGIYSLSPESREEDAIKAAGGLSNKADVHGIAKSMNMAAKLSDGMKLYLPFVGDTSTGSVQGGVGSSVEGASTGSISINSATESQLDSLPGVGPVTAGKIISNRPYASVDELLSKKAVTSSVFQKIKDLITL